MRASEALTYEPAAEFRRLQAANPEFFFEDLDEMTKEQHRRFLEELMSHERQRFLNARVTFVIPAVPPTGPKTTGRTRIFD